MSRSIGLRTVNSPSPSRSVPVDEVPMVAVEERLRLGETRLVLGVELLVVGAERGVGDLETRLRLGRHRSGTSGSGRASERCDQSSAGRPGHDPGAGAAMAERPSAAGLDSRHEPAPADPDRDRPPDGGPGRRPLPGPPGGRARRRAPAVHRRGLGDLRPRQRRRSRPGLEELSDAEGLPLLPAPERAGAWSTLATAFATPCNRLRAYACTASVGPGLAEHGDGCRDRDRQSDPGPAPAERHLRQPRRRSRPPAGRAPARARRLRERRVPAASRATSTGSRARSSSSRRCPRRSGS